MRLPNNTCGECKFCVLQPQQDGVMCIGLPPIAILEDGEAAFVRGIPISAADPECYYFKPRLNA